MKADHQQIKRRLSIVKGQIEGIVKMVDEDAYCIDISNQILAAIAMLKNANKAILSAHLDHCIPHASGEELDRKLAEIDDIIGRLD